MNSRKHEARIAGLLYLLMAVAAVVSLNNVPSCCWIAIMRNPYGLFMKPDNSLLMDGCRSV